jgi:hypothetical protein
MLESSRAAPVSTLEVAAERLYEDAHTIFVMEQTCSDEKENEAVSRDACLWIYGTLGIEYYDDYSGCLAASSVLIKGDAHIDE